MMKAMKWLALSVLALAFPVVNTHASIPAADGTYTGCYLKGIGSLRLVDAATQRCNAMLEVTVTWKVGGSGDPLLQSKIDTEAATRQTADRDILANLTAEVARAMAAETTLAVNLNNESTRAQTAEVGLTQRLAVLEQAVTALQATVASQRNLITALQTQRDGDEAARIAADSVLQTQINSIQSGGGSLGALQPYVSVVTGTLNGTNGPHIIFTGANVWIQSGSGATDDGGSLRGLGNLIVGYNTSLGNGQDRRTGSHNLIGGNQNQFSSFGGVVFGGGNSVEGPYASVTGGALNRASGSQSSVSGGTFNVASGIFSSVTGGNRNTATSNYASVTGGVSNSANGQYSSVSGGAFNAADGLEASVSGGYNNRASVPVTSVSGGRDNMAAGYGASVTGGYSNIANGDYSSVSGGRTNATLNAPYSSVSGGEGVVQDSVGGWSAGSQGAAVTGKFSSP